MSKNARTGGEPANVDPQAMPAESIPSAAAVDPQQEQTPDDARRPRKDSSARVVAAGKADDSERHAFAVSRRAVTDLGGNLLPGQGPVEQRLIQSVHQRHSFTGPMPHPSIMAGYGDLVPTAPERILKVFEADSQHTRDFEMGALVAQRADNKRVHWMAFTLIGGGYLAAFAFALMDKDLLAGTVLGTTMVATLVGFLQGNKDKTKRSDSASDSDDEEG